MVELIYKTFTQGVAPVTLFIITATVSYIFILTFIVCLLDRGLRKAKKSFFSWLCAFALTLSATCYALDFLTARSFSVFSSAVWFSIQALLFFLEYGVLAVQSVCFVAEKPNRANVWDATKSGVYAPGIKTTKNPVYHTKLGCIEEVGLKKPVRKQMETPRTEECLGESYVKACIEKLKVAPLLEEDALKLKELERSFTPPVPCATPEEKKKVSECGGELISLMAKYF